MTYKNEITQNKIQSCVYIYFKRVIFQIDSDFTMLNTQSREKFVAQLSTPNIYSNSFFPIRKSCKQSIYCVNHNFRGTITSSNIQ